MVDLMGIKNDIATHYMRAEISFVKKNARAEREDKFVWWTDYLDIVD